jgi:hypothetical protein
MRGAWHIKRRGERRGLNRVLVGKPEGRDHLGDPGIDGWIILRWNFMKWEVGAWNGSSWRNKLIEKRRRRKRRNEEEKKKKKSLLCTQKSPRHSLLSKCRRCHGVGALKYNFIRSHKNVTFFLVPIFTNL